MLIGFKHLYKCMHFFQHNKGKYSIINSRGIHAWAHYWFLCHWILPHSLAMRSGNWGWVQKGQTSALWVEVSWAVLCSRHPYLLICVPMIICCIFMLTGLRCVVTNAMFWRVCSSWLYSAIWKCRWKKMIIHDFILGQRNNLIRLTAVNRLLLSYSFPPWCSHL
jgi:hypothetical protein